MQTQAESRLTHMKCHDIIMQHLGSLHANVAQPVEQLIRNQQASGSSPLIGSIEV